MHDIVSSVERVTSIMTEIMIAGEEQSEGINQINQAIVSMDEVTQQNAALVEEAAAAANAMQEQAAQLEEMVSTFKLDTSGAHSRGGSGRAALRRPALALN
jgi:methyl-accepting chemotaxis protein-1 (serine sensor receptor)